MEELRRKREYDQQQEEMAYQAYLHEYEMDWQQEQEAYQAQIREQEWEAQRRQFEESLVQQLAEKDAEIRLIFSKQEVPKYKFASFKKIQPLESPSKPSSFEIQSFKGFNSMQEDVVPEQDQSIIKSGPLIQMTYPSWRGSTN